MMFSERTSRNRIPEIRQSDAESIKINLYF